MTTALLDGDIIAFRCAAAAEVDFDGTAVGSLDQARQKARQMVHEWMTGARASRAFLVFSPKAPQSTFRYRLWPEYKANRAGMSKPDVYIELVEYLEKNWIAMRLGGLEADDVLGILGTSHNDYTVVSIDKDIFTLPCKVYRPGQMLRPVRQTPSQANRYWLMQTLIGDSSDGYKGCPGIGTKRAEALLQGVTSSAAWGKVVQAFQDKGLTEEDAILQARLARILRSGDYDFRTGDIKLWHPNPSLTLTISADSTTLVDPTKNSTDHPDPRSTCREEAPPERHQPSARKKPSRKRTRSSKTERNNETSPTESGACPAPSAPSTLSKEPT